MEGYVQRGSDLPRQLLGFARGGKYEVRPTDLGGFITESSELFGRTKKEIRIHRHIQQDLWSVEVDQGQMEQVLINMYVNAWQAMPSGAVPLRRDVKLSRRTWLPYGLAPEGFGR
jgi:C4-dicarboxylate-specific signal transduction histidine kinase